MNSYFQNWALKMLHQALNPGGQRLHFSQPCFKMQEGVLTGGITKSLLASERQAAN